MLRMTITGHIGSDARVNQVNGKFVTNFSVAVNERYADPSTGEQLEKTTWVNCAKWDAREGNLWKFLKKGTQVLVEGKPEFKVYRQKDNTPGTDIGLRVNIVELLGSKEKPANNQSQSGEKWNWGDDGSANGASDKESDDPFWSDPAVMEAEFEKMKAAGAGDPATIHRKTPEEMLEGVEDPFGPIEATS